ncbi:voltage-gated chloride channel [Kockovaella imperatae]|uniref:Chloride channel protein n=1 Tax=Kockovaella imperatae TaxID=4999 RepID=A0A1Y1U6H8_9TREE|nr:voltage-gated chloride channel [Kockovaella imperatae]ORX33602.1 voltage-gated chloride channel [Kockovaella imperatae]
MSYPPPRDTGSIARDGRINEDQADSPLMNGDGDDDHNRDAGNGDVEDEEEKDLIRRYEDFSTVDWIQDSLHERNIRARQPKRSTGIKAKLDQLDGLPGYAWRAIDKVLEEGQSWVVISIVGIGIGLSSALMSLITVWLSDMKMGYCQTGWWLNQKFCCLELADEGEGCAEWRNWGGVEPFRWIAYILFAGLFSFSAAYLVRSFAPYAAGSGISEIKCILGGFIIKGFLSVETFLLKTLTMPLAIASGLSVGKEGPSVHVACSFGNIAARLFSRYDRSHLKMREVITASSAAGVAVAFGSPIGGVLFSIEEMNQTFSTRTMWYSFVCALVATFTVASMDPFRTGKLVLFQVSYDRDWHYFEIPAYIIIGLFGGLYGALVIKFNLQMASFRRKHLANHAVLEAVTLATLTAFVGYLNRFLRIDMTESMEILFHECEGGGDRRGLCQTSAQWRMVNALFLATIIRTFLIIVSYGCKVPCGIFVPSMAVGAYFGRMIGIIMKALHTSYPGAPWFATCAPDAPCITPGTYAFLGAAAALGGVTRLTVTVVVIMFELTGALTYILPTMIVLLVTKAVSDWFGGGGIADRMIRFNGYPFLEKEDKEDGDHAFIEPIANVMKKDLTFMPASGVPLQKISEIVQGTSYQGFPVVRSETDRTVVGFVRKTELRYAVDRAMRTRHLSNNATCTFQCIAEEADKPNGLLGEPDIVIAPRKVSTSRSRSPVASRSEARSSAAQADLVDFGQYVDETPLTVAPKMPLEIVMQLFRRMGPRVILVVNEGQLVGLVTVKDVLRYEATLAHRSSHSGLNTPITPSSRMTHRQRNAEGFGSTDSWGERWQSMDDGMRGGGNGFEIALEEALSWVRIKGTRAYNLVYERIRPGRTSRTMDERYDYELEEGTE